MLKPIALFTCSLLFLINSLQAQQITRGPYLQKGTPSNMIIRWRTDIVTLGKVMYGTNLANLTDSLEESVTTTEHIIELTGLTSNTVFYYNVGTTTRVLLAAGAGMYFKTSPVPGSRQPVRIWAIGDFGNGSQGQINVMNSYLNYTSSTHTDAWIWLGDNAYGSGTQQEYQDKVFNIYTEPFKKIVAWPAPGNHDYGSVDISNNGPYYDIFSLPTNGEAGGEPSGTEGYYSFDYGNVHFVSLNSEFLLWTISSSSAMAEWLKDDLENNHKDWTIAYWHQPPYTKGSHDSDDFFSRSEMMRSYINPILEDHGVDLVLCGHSHCYERSYLIKGHYGKANTFSRSSMIVDSVSPFVKYVDGNDPNEGTIYAVVGVSGQLDASGNLNHPAMAFSTYAYNGSLVIDIDSLTLTAKFLTALDGIKDDFSIQKKSVLDTMATGITSAEQTGEMIIMPNPVNESFQIEFNLRKMTTSVVSLINIKGAQIAILHSGNLNPEERKTFSATDYPPGIYFVKLSSKEISLTTKIVLKR